MSLEAIKTISEAEEAVRRKKAEAQQEARRAVAEAQAAADAAVEAARVKAAEELQGVVKAADDKSRADALELASSTENKKAAMRVHAESRLDAAARFITERIVNS